MAGSIIELLWKALWLEVAEWFLGRSSKVAAGLWCGLG